MSVSEPPISVRTASVQELARIQKAGEALARTAGWSRVMAIYLPVLLGAGTFAYSMAAVPGPWPTSFLTALIAPLAIACALSLPVLLTSTGRTLRWYARFKEDRASGFAIARERGEVRWGSGTYVASVQGKPLFSPFFTRFEAIPAYWNHFELLPPGAYVFELLRESRLVVGALPVPRDDRRDAHAALLAAFKVCDSDLAANRKGQATGRQRVRLILANWPFFLMSPLIAWGCALGLVQMWRSPHLGASLGLLVGLCFTAFALVYTGRVLWDAFEAKVESAVGPVSFRYGRTEATGSIGSLEFTASHAHTRALQPSCSYRVFYFRRSRRLVGAEPV